MTTTFFAKANRQLQRAIKRGDVDDAIRWTSIMAGQIHIARSLTDLHAAKPTPKPKRRKPVAPAAAPTPNLPAMLDPDGFSPGGTPNWALNQQRLQRAGLPISLAPPTRSQQRKQNPTAP